MTVVGSTRLWQKPRMKGCIYCEPRVLVRFQGGTGSDRKHLCEQHLHDDQTAVHFLPSPHPGCARSILQPVLFGIFGQSESGSPLRRIFGGGSLSNLHALSRGDGEGSFARVEKHASTDYCNGELDDPTQYWLPTETGPWIIGLLETSERIHDARCGRFYPG